MKKKPHTSEIEQYVINKVKELRKERKISQQELAFQLDISVSFIGEVESVRTRAKYNLNHINAIAKLFNCSPQDFLPQEPLN